MTKKKKGCNCVDSFSCAQKVLMAVNPVPIRDAMRRYQGWRIMRFGYFGHVCQKAASRLATTKLLSVLASSRFLPPSRVSPIETWSEDLIIRVCPGLPCLRPATCTIASFDITSPQRSIMQQNREIKTVNMATAFLAALHINIGDHEQDDDFVSYPIVDILCIDACKEFVIKRDDKLARSVFTAH